MYIKDVTIIYVQYAYCMFYIRILYTVGSIRLKPGCDALQSLESEVNGVLGQIREQIGKLIL